jgi:uncharacterized damage-inducible protein DinB
MNEILLNYTEYNVWANKLIAAVLCTLTEEESKNELGGSFSSIRNTAQHLWLAESVWLQRLNMAEHVVLPAENFSGDLNDICQLWLTCSEDLFLFTKKIKDERGLEHQFHYTNIKGEFHKSKVWECLHHVCNHSTLHRGQLITYLRQIGVTEIPATDFIAYCRGKK